MIGNRDVWSQRASLVLAALVMMTFVTANCFAGGAAEAPKSGGVLNIAMDAEPAGLDNMVSSATLITSVAWHIFENLFTFGEKMEVIPMLGKDYSISADGLKYTINLREGIPFHNGGEMKADDVIASLNRWGKVSSVGKSTFKNVEALNKKNDYQIEKSKSS